jgi:hypothetical protein
VGRRFALALQYRRLAIELNGRVTIYDTLDHQIGGFSQQQSYGGSLSFNSQHGPIDVARLPIVSVDGIAQAAPAQTPPDVMPQRGSTGNVAEPDIFATIDKLAELLARL